MAEVPDTEENLTTCVCGGCPSKPPGDMILYCVKGESPTRGNGGANRSFCACSWCPVWSGYGLEAHFYCGEGAGKDGIYDG